MARRPVVRRPVRLTRIERAVAFVLRHPVKLSAAAFAVLSASGTAWAFQTVLPGLPVLHFELSPIEYQTKELGTTVDRLVLIDLEARLVKAQADMKAAPSGTVQKTVDALNHSIKNTKARLCKANPSECE